MSIPAPLDRGRMEGRCAACDHVWVVAYLPMPLDRAGVLMHDAKCPRGCIARVVAA